MIAQRSPIVTDAFQRQQERQKEPQQERQKRIVSISITERGAALARQLPYEHMHGAPRETIQRLWHEVDGLILMFATGAAVRLVGPLLDSKEHDPGVVCVDEAGRWAVALCGGHAGRANALANDVAALIGAQSVVTTATDAAAVPSLDMLPGFMASGDVAGVTAALLDGRPPLIVNHLAHWPTPAALLAGDGPERVVITDETVVPQDHTAVLHPPSLVVGMGCSLAASSSEAVALVDAVLRESGLARQSISCIATIDRRTDHPAIKSLELPVRAFPAMELAGMAPEVPNPSHRVAQAVGTPSVAEAAALLAAGKDAQLVVTKRASQNVTVAIARRAQPCGRLSVVGLGPGSVAHRTPAAAAAVRHAETVIGYGPYLHQAEDLISSTKLRREHPIGQEEARARQALLEAAAGRQVALVCSGDAGVYAMASLVCELAHSVAPDVEVDVIPGVSAAQAAASLLGAPLGHDHLIISLSDLRTPWATIETRIVAAAESDLTVAIYNPRSGGRRWQLDAALELLRKHRSPETPVGIVRDAYRPDQNIIVATLEDFDSEKVDMATCVIVGSSSTRFLAGRMVTPRGYLPCP